MKKNFYYIFILSITTLLLFSCNKKQYAGFQNSYPNYAHYNSETEKSEDLEVSASNEPVITIKKEPLVKLEEKALKEKPEPAKTEKAKAKKTDLLKVVNEVKKHHKKDLSKAEKKDLKRKRKEIKQALKSDEGRTVFLTILLVFLAILIPPLAVLLVDGLRGPFWLSLLLTLLFYFPGLIYALYRVFKKR